MKDRRAGFLISQIHRLSSRKFETLLKEEGISAFNGAQGRILYVLWNYDDIPIFELASKTGLAKTTLTSMLDRMEKNSLLSRNYESQDRRQIKIKLTEKARKLQENYESISNRMNEIYYKGMTDKQIDEFEKYLDIILNNLND